MGALAWWAIPIVSTLIAIGWVALTNRTRPREDAHDSMRDYERLRAALAATSEPGRKRGS